MVLGGHGVVIRMIRIRREFGNGFPSEFGPDLRSDSGFVELFLVVEKSLLLLPGFLLVETFPLPFVDTAGKGSWTAAHWAGEEEGAEKLGGGAGMSSKDRRVHDCS